MSLEDQIEEPGACHMDDTEVLKWCWRHRARLDFDIVGRQAACTVTVVGQDEEVHSLVAACPSMGLAPNLVDMIFQTIVQLNGDGATILLVEQNAHKAVRISHRVYALKTGSIAFSGTSDHPDLEDILHSAYLT